MAYDEATAAAICERISREPISLHAVLRETGPSPAEFYRWLDSEDSLRENYARARMAQADADADAIADVRNRVLDGDLSPEQARVAIDSLKWSAGRRNRAKYGDKSEVALTGANGSDLFASLGKAELLAELSRRMSSPELQRALQALPGVASGALALPKPKP